MKWLKKVASLFYYIALVFLAVFAINSEGLDLIFNTLKNSNGSILIKIADYFKYADTWNLIFFFMFFAASIGLMMIFNLLYDRFFKWIVKKKPKLSFLNSAWADWTIQKGAALITIIFLFWLTSNIIIPVQSSKHMVESVGELPHPMPVLVLGTSKMLRSGKGENVYYRQRIDAAMELFRAGKSTFFILSGDGGDGRTDGYDETRDMRDDLMAQGVPEEKIKIDTAGFRTLDSILRLRVLFKMNDIIIVSQAFHQPRSIFLCNFYGLKPYGYSAKGSATFAMIKREAFSSRPGMIMDLIFANMQPRVLGPGEQALQFREGFEAKSDLHILILIGLFVLVFVMIMGLGVYQSKEGEERIKAVKRYIYGGSGIFVLLIVMIASVYKNLDIKFVEELVESVAKVVGVQTEKMEVKQAIVKEFIEKIESEKKVEQPTIEPVKVDSAALMRDAQLEMAKLEAEKMNAIIISKNENKSIVKKDSMFNAVTVITPKEPEPEKKKNPFNVAKIGGIKVDNGVTTPVDFFTVKIHNTQPVNNDSEIFMRTNESLLLGGKVIAANTVFTARANVFDGKINFIVDKINDVNVKGIKNYSVADKKEGMKIEDRFYQGGKLVLSDGEPILFSKIN